MKNYPVNHPRPGSGHTLIEMLIAVAILTSVLTAAVSGFAYVLRADRLIAKQNELDMDARSLLNRLRYDLWQTSRELIQLYPPDNHPYTAISFPVLSGAGAINTNGIIEWDRTVIYHFWTNDQFEVRRTEFTSWIANDTDRQAQLADVAVDGNGSGATNGNSSTTRTLISNLVDWQINITTNTIDFGASSERIEEVYLGSARILSGSNNITFRSAGGGIGRYALTIDRLNLTPSGLPLEAEWMNVSASSGATPAVQNMGSNETWSGNSRLHFPATAAGQSFTLDFTNDRWEERGFSGDADSLYRLKRIMVDDYTASTFGLHLEGSGVVWQAEQQTRDTGTPEFMSSIDDLECQVLLRGDDIMENFDGGWIGFNGTNIWVTFEAGRYIEARFKDLEISMSEASLGNTNNWEESINGTEREIKFSGNSDTGWFTGIKSSDPLGYLIERSNTYLLGFTIQGRTNTRFRVWRNDASASSRDMYIESAGVWTNAIYGFNRMRAGHAPLGSYLSPVIDTTLSNPDFTSISWREIIPAGYSSPSPSVNVQIRAGNSPDLNAVSWVNAVKDSVPAIAGRYVQVQVTLRAGAHASTRETATPELHDFTLEWEGDERFAPVSGKFLKGPSQGVYDVLVNGMPLMKGVTIDLEVYSDLEMGFGGSKRVTASAFTEIIPRN